jgi:RNA polymerase sigma-70 factor (ECF subfamily)
MAEEIESVYREQYSALVGFATRRIRDRARAEELAQEAFMRALREQPDNPRAWLYTVVANMIRDDGRRRAVRRRELSVVREQTEVLSEPVDESLDRDRRVRRVRAALATLADRDRDALMLKERGHSYDEIAERLGLSRGSIGTTLARARQRLVAAWHDLAGAEGEEA